MNFGTKVAIATPPFAGSRASTSSGMLRGWSQTAREEEWEKITGATERVERVPHRRRRDVREVDEHAERGSSRVRPRGRSRQSPPTPGSSVAESAQAMLSLCVSVM